MRIFVVYKFVLILALIPKNRRAFPQTKKERPYFVHLHFTFVTEHTFNVRHHLSQLVVLCLLYVTFCTGRIKARFYFLRYAGIFLRSI